MPWTETAPMAERMRFVTDWERDLYSMVELCERYGVSRKTGYKWLARYEADGPDGLRERSRAPHQCPHRIAPEVATLICAARRQHPRWGPAKLVARLRPRQPAVDWPALSAPLFRADAFPRPIPTDQGVPFPTTGIPRLAQLNVWWLRLGIQHQRILPPHPQQTGAHERIPKPLKGGACRPPHSRLATQ